MGGVVNISDLLRLGYIDLNLAAADKEAAVKGGAPMGKDHPDIEDFPSFCRAGFEREGGFQFGGICRAKGQFCRYLRISL